MSNEEKISLGQRALAAILQPMLYKWHVSTVNTSWVRNIMLIIFREFVCFYTNLQAKVPKFIRSSYQKYEVGEETTSKQNNHIKVLNAHLTSTMKRRLQTKTIAFLIVSISKKRFWSNSCWVWSGMKWKTENLITDGKGKDIDWLIFWYIFSHSQKRRILSVNSWYALAHSNCCQCEAQSKVWRIWRHLIFTNALWFIHNKSACRRLINVVPERCSQFYVHSFRNQNVLCEHWVKRATLHSGVCNVFGLHCMVCTNHMTLVHI